MIFEPINRFYPKIAEKEVQLLVIEEGEELPSGMFILMPTFCTDKKCDCRRTIINVLSFTSKGAPGHVASISYGWESMEFYRKWSLGLSEEMLRDFKGPALDFAQQQSKFAPLFLKKISDTTLKNNAYIKLLKRNYVYIKRKIGMKMPKDLISLLNLYGDCPCGSRISFSLCCGRLDNRLRRR
jgi:hypothetical protein